MICRGTNTFIRIYERMLSLVYLQLSIGLSFFLGACSVALQIHSLWTAMLKRRGRDMSAFIVARWTLSEMNWCIKWNYCLYNNHLCKDITKTVQVHCVECKDDQGFVLCVLCFWFVIMFMTIFGRFKKEHTVHSTIQWRLYLQGGQRNAATQEVASIQGLCWDVNTGAFLSAGATRI